MSADLIVVTAVLWAVGGLTSLVLRQHAVSRVLLALGCLSGVIACVFALPDSLQGGGRVNLSLASEPVAFELAPSALWLMGFGLVPAGFACWLGSPVCRRPAAWCVGAALSLLGALGVFGLQDGMSLLIAWEVMSLGGALLLIGEHADDDDGKPVLFMLALLDSLTELSL